MGEIKGSLFTIVPFKIALKEYCLQSDWLDNREF